MLRGKSPSSSASQSWWTTSRRASIAWCSGLPSRKHILRWASVLGLVCSLVPSASAQVAGEKPAVREPIRPRLVASIPVGRIRYYELEEHTRVERLFADSTRQSWERQVTSLLRLYAFTSRENATTDVACRIERLHYRFRHDTLTVEFDSQHPERTTRRIPDLEYASMLLGTEAEILFSSYGDIARVGGEQLEWLQNYLQSELSTDPSRRAAMLAAISPARWAALFDLHKGIVPGIRVREDSSWKRLTTLWLEAVEWSDTAHVHIAQTTDTTRILVGVLPHLQLVSSRVWLPDLPSSPVSPRNGSGHAQITVELAPQGRILRSELHAHTEYDAVPEGHGQPFRQTVQVTLRWRLVREE